MRVQFFLRDLYNRLSTDEWKELKLNDPVILKGRAPSLPVSEFNRQQLLRLKSLFVRGAEGKYRLRDVDTDMAEHLEKNLKEFLDDNMADQPEAHKYIIVVCLYLTFVEREPMHPQEATGWEKVTDGGKTVYYCPYKNDSITCSYCVCRKASERV